MSSAEHLFSNLEAMNKSLAQACMMWGQSYFNLIDSMLKFWRLSSNFYTQPTAGGFS